MNPLIQIAIVDDHPALRKGLISLLVQDNIEVIIEANNGKDLIEQLDQSSIIPKICVTDIEMPIMNGYDTTSYLKNNFPEIKVIGYSFYEHEFSIINLLKKGAVGYIFKSADPQELITAIRSVNHVGYYHSESFFDKSAELLNNYNNSKLDFSEKEIQFMSLCCSDLYYDEIANIMEISPRTIDGYRDRCFRKLKIKSRAALVLFALQTGLVKPYSNNNEFPQKSDD